MFHCLKREPGFYRRIASLGIPVLLQHLITNSLGFVDTFMVGLIGNLEMSAVTAANVPVTLFQMILFGFQSGSAVLFSQYWGKKDVRTINRVLGLGFYTAGGFGLLFAMLLFFQPEFVMSLVTNNKDIIALAAPYVHIVGFSYAFNSLSMIYINMESATENPKLGTTVLGISTACNTALNYVFIFGAFGLEPMGIRGAALATLISRIIEFVITFSYAFLSRRVPLMANYLLRPGKVIFASYMKYCSPVILNETLWGLGTSMFTVIMGHMALSADMLAAYTVAGNISRLTVAGMFGMSAAAGVIIGKEIGLGNFKNVYSIGCALCLVSCGVGITIGLLEVLLLPTLLQPILFPLFNLTAFQAQIAAYMVIFYAITCPAQFYNTTVIVGILRGGGDVRAAAILDLTPMWCISIVLTALVALVFKAPPIFVIMAIHTENWSKVPFFTLRLRSKKWIKDVTVS
ncbi:MAG: MATE family efflux transporter, partial [Oscillospiraceae bacterium]|nr:MATE family efflux transporter [Oscillospiraceae bacterium]